MRGTTEMRSTAFAGVVFGALLSACSSSNAPADAAVDAYRSARTTFRAIPAANAVEVSNEFLRDGEQDFFYETWGMEAYPLYPPTDFVRTLMRDDPMFGDQLSRFGMLRDPNDEFPIGLKPGTRNPGRLHETCSGCHAARLPDGRIWSGAPNTGFDFEGLRRALHERWVAAGNEPYSAPEELRRQGLCGPGRTRADGHEDPVVIALDYPAIYDLGLRRALNYAGTGRDARSEILLSLFGSGLGAPNPETTVAPFPAVETLAPFVAYFSSRKPPPAPQRDAALVERGRAVFEREKCGSCHASDVAMQSVTPHRRGERELVPGEDPMFPRGSIATDKARFELVAGFDESAEITSDAGVQDASLTTLHDGGTPDAGASAGALDASVVDPIDMYRDYILFITRYQLGIGSSTGYRQLDLRGVWQSAPYLHNGSVPTLDALLRPASSRPSTFQRGSYTVTTNERGFTNVGHEFATAMSDADRAAIIAYLETL